MARKSRVPDPPRRVQAPQRRRAPVEPTDARRQRLLLYGLAGSGFVALAIVIVVFLLARGGSDVAATMRSAGCTFQTFPAREGRHIADTQKPKWNSYPPTNGDQSGTLVVWGDYDDPISLRSSIHNLEHGGVAIYYGSKVPAATVRRLREFYAGDPNGLLLAPLPSLEDRITLGAWYVANPQQPEKGVGVLARCGRFDESAFAAFVDRYRGKGPERVPVDALAPGT